jgi:transglutaminase-like putative cysteine protease
MRLKISHRIEYRPDQPAQRTLYRLRLFPVTGPTQTVRSWSLAVAGAREEVRFSDHFGNDTRLVSVEAGEEPLIVEAAGEVETVNKAGVTGKHRGFAPLWLFQRETPLTAAGDGIRALASGSANGADVGHLHALMAAVAEAMPEVPADEGAAASAEEALARGGGAVDKAHVFISAARLLGFPARFVGGHRATADAPEGAAIHAWAEAHVEGLGWVGFDVEAGISPDDGYVRVATGRDHREVRPFSGLQAGLDGERLAVRVSLEQ